MWGIFINDMRINSAYCLRLSLLLPPQVLGNLPRQCLEEASRLGERQDDAHGCAHKDDDEGDDDPGREEAFAEDVVREEHGHWDLRPSASAPGIASDTQE